jgi:tetratricopeptide (TPR) repeat protein
MCLPIAWLWSKKEKVLLVRKSFETVLSSYFWLVVLIFLFSTAQSTQLNSQENPPRTSPAYDRAFQLLQAGQTDAALVEVDTALAREPNDPSLNNLRGLVTAKLGRTAEAESSFRNVIHLLPHGAMGYNNLAALLWQLGRTEEAAKSFRQALTEEPYNFTALVGLGTILAESRKYAGALPYLEKAWGSQPGDFQAGYELAWSLTELKRPAEAQKVLTKIAPPQDNATRAKFYVLSAEVAEQLADQAAARRDYLRAYNLIPQSFEVYLALVRSTLAMRDSSWTQLPPAPSGLSAEQHFTLGLMFASSGAYSAAISHFQQTLQLEPTSYLAAYNLALAYKKEGKSQFAIELLEHTVEQQPNAELYDLLASLEEGAGLYVQAVRHYQKAVDRDPEKEQYYFDLGAEYLVHLTLGPALEVFRVGSQKFPASPRLHVGNGLAQFALRQYDDAADAFMDALEIDPSSPDAFLAWNALPTFVAVAAWERIEPRLRNLAERFPENPQAVFCYAQALFHQGVASNHADGLDLAQPLLEKVVRLNPRWALARLELGAVYAQRKQSEKAVASFLEAIRLDPNSEMAHYKLGQIYRDLNQLTLAERELDLYRKLARNHRDQMARNRSAIRQFVLARPAYGSASTQENAPL